MLTVGLLLVGGAVAAGIAAGQFKEQRDTARDAETKANRARSDADISKDEAVKAKLDADHKLWDSLVAQADANRLSRRSGQRFATLDRLHEAVALAKKLELPPSAYLRMRNTAVAALALPDLHPGPPFIDWPEGTQSIDLPEAFDIYARSDNGGTCTVRRVEEDGEICKLPGLSPHFSRDGKYLALSQPDKSVRVWRLGNPEPVAVLDCRDAAILRFDLAGVRVACVHGDHSLDVFDLTTGRNVLALTTAMIQREPMIALHPTEPLIAACSYHTNDVRIWDLRNGRSVTFIPSAMNGNVSLTWNPAGTVLAVANNDGEIKFHESGT